MIPDVSIVLSCYKRGQLLANTLESIQEQNKKAEVIVVEDGDDGLTEAIAKRFCARYFRKTRADLPAFENPSRVHNIGIRQATGHIVILQGGEIKFETKPNGLAMLVDVVLSSAAVAATPLVQNLDEQGKFCGWLVAPRDCDRAGWIINFCLAVRRQKLLAIGGFEESYRGYGFEDDQLMYSLRKSGVNPVYVESCLTSHQWHPRTNYQFENSESRSKFDTFVQQVEKEGRPPVANVGRSWGQL